MTNLRTTIDIEWQNVMNSSPNVNFNFYNGLKDMTSTIQNNFFAQYSHIYGRVGDVPQQDIDSC